MKKLKIKLIVLSILATVSMSSTPIFAATNIHNNANSNLLMNHRQANKAKQGFKVRLKEYTYANAPESAKRQYEEDCKAANLATDPSHKIFVYENEKDYSNIDSITYNPDDFKVWLSGETAYAKGNDGTLFDANIDQDYVGYNCTTKGDPVYIVQIMLNKDAAIDRHLYINLAVDGIFGPNTYSAIKDFQSWVGDSSVKVDGIVGPVTWMNLLNDQY